MKTGHGNIVHFYLGHRAADELILFHPELAGVRLRFGVGRPVVADMFVLAGNLATIATITNANVDDKYFPHL
jgi:hypothetical protein